MRFPLLNRQLRPDNRVGWSLLNAPFLTPDDLLYLGKQVNKE
jgi:hypothetical protein